MQHSIDVLHVALAGRVPETDLERQKLVFLASQHGVLYPLERAWKGKVAPDSKFVYLCSNETVNGIEVFDLPTKEETGGVSFLAH